MSQKKKTQKTVIYGGSFAPPHFGHIDIVNNLKKRFDTVIVMPAHISPLKEARDDAQLRLKLCKKAFVDVAVSSYEIKKGGISYTADTVKRFSKGGAELYFCIGSETVATLERWKNFEYLAKTVIFYIIPRPGFSADISGLKALKKRYKLRYKIAPFSGLDISSTEVMVDLAFNKPNKYLPDAVYALVKANPEFNAYAVLVKKLEEYGLSQYRVDHSYYAALSGIKLAKTYQLNVADVVTALILHDIAKDADSTLYDVDESLHPKVKHAAVAERIAADMGIPEHICRAIGRHTAGSTDMTDFDKAVYLADKIEATREYDGLEMARYLAFIDLDLAMQYTLEITAKKHKDNEEILQHFKLLNAQKPVPSRPEPQKKVMPAALTKAENITPKMLAHICAAALSEKKGREIDIIDLTAKTILTDYFVIASATSTTAVKALYEFLDETLSKKYGIEPYKRDVDSDWVAVDYGSVIVHIFRAQTRAFYNIERLWSDGANITRFED